MIPLHVVMNVEEVGFDAMKKLGSHGAIDQDALVRQGVLIHLNGDQGFEVGGLDHGMTSGRASVAFCFELPDGRVVLAETSLWLLQLATAALTARYGE